MPVASAASMTSSGDGRRRSWLGWRTAVLGLLVLLLLYQVVVPFVLVIWTSFKTVPPGGTGFLRIQFSLDNYIGAFFSPAFWRASWETLLFAGASTLTAFVLGTFLSWVVKRTNTPFARLIGVITLARIVIPSILIAITWIFVASPSIGLLNHLITQITGIHRAVNVYTFWGMVWVQSLEIVPLAYLLTSAAFQATDPRLEEASVMTGAGTWRTFRRISLPLITPAVGSVGLLLFIYCIEAFEVPLLLGGRAHVSVFATEVYYNAATAPINWGLSSTYSMALLALSVVLLLGYFYLVRHGERYQTVTGKDFRPRRIDLGTWKYVTCAISLLLVFLITGLPFLILLYASFLPPYLGITIQSLDKLTLSNYVELLGSNGNADALVPLWHSGLLGVVSATTVMLVVSAISYFVIKTRIPFRKGLDFLAFAPMALPSVIIGAAFLWFYLLVPLPILDTIWVIALAYLTKFMPLALRFVTTSMMQIHSELEEAADVTGAPWWKNFLRIYLPLLKPGLMAGWFWVMVHAFRELTIALMLARGDNHTAAVIIYNLWNTGSLQQVSALGVIMFTILIALVAIFHSISRRYGIREYA